MYYLFSLILLSLVTFASAATEADEKLLSITKRVKTLHKDEQEILTDLKTSLQQALDQKDYAEAMKYADLQASLDPSSGLMSLIKICDLANQPGELIKTAAAMVDKTNSELRFALVTLCHSAQLPVTAKDALKLLESKRSSIPSEMYKFFHSGLLIVSGEKEAGVAEFKGIDDLSPFDGEHLNHPILTGSF